jgi:hypothetical protein
MRGQIPGIIYTIAFRFDKVTGNRYGRKSTCFTSLIFVILIVTVFAFPSPLYCAWDTCRTAPRALTIFTQNDLFNASWAVNTDDYRSFGFGGNYALRYHWNVTAEYYGLTCREGAKQGKGNRADELSINASRRFRYLAPYQRLDLIPEAGILLAGDIGSQYIQNSWHRFNKLPEVDMTYDSKFLATLTLGGKFGYAFVDHVFGNAEFSLQTGGCAVARPGYDAKLEIGESTHLKSTWGDLFFLEFIYRYVDPFVNDRVVRRIAEIESGWTWRYVVQAGGLYVSNEFGLTSDNATGSLGVSFQLDTGSHSFSQEDYEFEGAIIPGKSGWMARIRAHPWQDGRFNLKADYLFLVPADIQYPTFRINHQQLTFGAEFALFPLQQKFRITPFVGAGIGILRSMRYSNVIDTVMQHRESPVVTGEIGVRVSGTIPLRFLPKNVVYGVSFSDLYTLPVKEYCEQAPVGSINYVRRYNCFPLGLIVAVDF